VARRLRQSRTARRLLFAREALRRGSPRLRRAAASNPARDALVPVLVDYYSRDGSTLTMRLLGSSPQVAVGGTYPFEHKFFAYLWRWSRLLTRPDWDEDEWAIHDLGSILQERDRSVLGPPPWRRRDLMDGADPEAPPMSEQAFDFAWREFSRRATEVTRVAHREPDADVRYYAEKHMNSWLLDRAELPPFRLLVLLRDPRDTYASLLAFREATKAELGQREAADDADYFRRFIERQRDRLRWIAVLEEDPETTIVRYDEVVRDLPGVSGRLERWLGVTLDADSVARDRRVGWVHRTAESHEQSIGRWRSDLPEEVSESIGRELRAELQALRFEA
jgi:Sulfotransferase family